MDSLVMCIVKERKQAESIVTRLRNIGIPTTDISVMFPGPESSTTFAAEQGTKAPEGALAGASTGGVLGGALGLALGLGALVIPGLGPFLAAGPILAAMGGAAAGAAVGSIAGGLIGLGIPEAEAKRYELRVRGGHLLISIHTSSYEDARRATSIFRSEGADEIYSTVEAPRNSDVQHSYSRP